MQAGQSVQRRVRQCFNRSAPKHREHSQAQHCIGGALVEMLSQHAKLPADGRVVEIGCGQSPLFAPLAQRLNFSTGIGVDLAERLLCQAQDAHEPWPRSGGRKPGKTAWIQADAHKLPLEDSCADLLLSSMALHWCLDAAQVVQEMRRVLKRGGWLGLAIPLFPSLERLRKRLADLGVSTAINAFWQAGQWQELLSLDVIDFQCQHFPLHCPDTPTALSHIRGVGGNCLWQQRDIGHRPAVAPIESKALGQWRNARRQPLWAEPIELGFHIGAWVLCNRPAA